MSLPQNVFRTVCTLPRDNAPGLTVPLLTPKPLQVPPFVRHLDSVDSVTRVQTAPIAMSLNAQTSAIPVSVRPGDVSCSIVRGQASSEIKPNNATRLRMSLAKMNQSTLTMSILTKWPSSSRAIPMILTLTTQRTISPFNRVKVDYLFIVSWTCRVDYYSAPLQFSYLSFFFGNYMLFFFFLFILLVFYLFSKQYNSIATTRHDAHVGWEWAYTKDTLLFSILTS